MFIGFTVSGCRASRCKFRSSRLIVAFSRGGQTTLEPTVGSRSLLRPAQPCAFVERELRPLRAAHLLHPLLPRRQRMLSDGEPVAAPAASAPPAPASPTAYGAACSSGCTPARPVHAYWIQYEEPLSSVPSLDVVRDCDLPQRLSPPCQSRVVIRLIATDAGRGLLTRPRSAED